MNLITLDGKSLIEQAKVSAQNRHNEKNIRKVRDLMLAHESFTNALKEIDQILKDIENNDALAYKKLDNISGFLNRLKTVVFERSNNKVFRYRDDEEDDEVFPF